MRFSTRSRYGVRAMYELAANDSNNPIPLKNIAKYQNISEHYLEQLMASLRKGGLVNSIRGAQGGYVLARPAEAITIAEIIRVLEGPVAPVECVREDQESNCFNIDNCVTRSIWEKVRDSVVDVLESITLASLLKKE